MPRLAIKELCSGCTACASVCPKQAIIMQPDTEGFLRPEINKELCVECGLCSKSCHVINQYIEKDPIRVYAAQAKDDNVRMASSSGGIFPILAVNVLNEGGFVWGVGWNNTNPIPKAVHKCISSVKELRELCGSKYVQSFLGNSFIKIKKQLESGKKVLFTGTPCQISGLRHYLKKEYENLICVDVICHGVPSPKVFNHYMQNLLNKTQAEAKKEIPYVVFRKKDGYGWRNGVVVVVVVVVRDWINGEIISEQEVSKRTQFDDPYLRAFLSELCNRPSCHDCQVKNLKSGSDLTIGDFWGVNDFDSSLDDNKGISILLANTEKGCTLIDAIKDELSVCRDITYEDAIKSTRALIESPLPHKKRNEFFSNYETEGFENCVVRLLKPSKMKLAKAYFKAAKRRIGNLLGL